MSVESVLVFGATGGVGSAVAQHAAATGCKVWLAMRDPGKKVNWLKKEEEESGIYTRVRADLGDPASLKEAVKQSGAKSAFIYILFEGADMKPTIQSLKDSGITWITLLSSISVHGNPRDIPKEDLIPYAHAQAEIALEEVGIPFAAVRPGFFSSNIFMWWIPQIKASGQVDLLYPELIFDMIAPKDIGTVAGSLLTQPQPNRNPNDPEIVCLLGPKPTSQEEAINAIARVSGKGIQINSVDANGYIESLKKLGFNEEYANFFARQFTNMKSLGQYYGEGQSDESVKNLKKYAGGRAITFDQYLESVKTDLGI